MDQDTATFAARVRHWRTRMDLSQERFAAVVGVTRNTVASWEAGLPHPRYRDLPGLVRGTGQPIEYWVRADDEDLAPTEHWARADNEDRRRRLDRLPGHAG